jgi:D-threo-aldose 1-dehydrogenase
LNPLEKVQIGRTGLEVTKLGLGGGSIGGLYFPVSDSQAQATVREALKLGINYIDTAPLYGLGKSESTIGQALAGVPRSTFVISTKVGRLISGDGSIRFDFTRKGIMNSLDSSLSRLGLNNVDIVYIHDPDNHYETSKTEAYSALSDLKSRGEIKAIGVGMNQWEMELVFAREIKVDCFLLAGRYTLLEQGALPEFLPECESRKISVIVGGPFNSGILASNLDEGAKYEYENASIEILRKARRIDAICRRHNVALKAAALQFILAHPAVASVIPGSRSPEEVRENFEMVKHQIPSELWRDLIQEGLLTPETPVPN